MDERISFRLRNDADADARYWVAGNPHTQNGLISLLPTDGGLGFSARFTELVAVNDISEGWLLGYASGNEPEFSPSEIADARIQRERDFYYRNGYPLALERSGLICVSSWVYGGGELTTAEVYDAYSRVLSEIFTCTDSGPVWTPVFEGILLDPPLPSEPSAEEIEGLFSRLNVEFRPDGGSEDWCLRLLARTERDLFASIEVNLRFERAGDRAYAAHVSVNLDAAGYSDAAFELESTSNRLRLLFEGVVRATSADCASISPARAAKLAYGFLVYVDDDTDPILAFPGWLTYLSDRLRVRYRETLNDLPEGFLIAEADAGSIVEFSPGIDRFSEVEANALASVFDD